MTRECLERVQQREDGAAMVFGVFFAVFLLACVYRLHALAEVVLFRQRIQDAADASAFAAAVVNARGMNLLALINMTMAAALSVLVALRIAQTLCLMGIGLCLALAYPTWGSSLNGVAPLTNLNRKIKKIASNVSDEMPNILSALHAAGKAISVVVPLGSNARVIELAINQYGQKFGVAIPGRLTLPVEDGNFLDLCRHAGELAGQIAVLPMSPVLPSGVQSAFASATGKLVASDSDWFCGKKGASPPDVDSDRKYDPVVLPTMPKQRQCSDLQARHQDATEGQEHEIEDACGAASAEYLASVPGQDGKPRVGEPLCPTDCVDRPRAACPPNGVELCTEQEALDIQKYADRSGQPAIVSGGADSPYQTRLALARKQCDPRAAHADPLGGVSSLQKTVTRVYRWVPHGSHPLQGGYQLSEEIEESSAQVVQREDEDRSVPCGPGGEVGPDYQVNRGSPVCEATASCLDDGGRYAFGPGIPCPRTPPGNGAGKTFRERVLVVTEILRCVELKKHQKNSIPSFDINKEMQSKSSDDQDTNPFQLEKDVWLGGGDFQLRSVVVAPEAPREGRSVVPLATWQEQEDTGLSKTARALGRLGLAQAEYYFDLRVFDDYANQTDSKDRVEWLWHQGWVARMRSFRLKQGGSTGAGAKSASADPSRTKYARGESLEPKKLSDCKDCGGLSKLLTGYGVGE